MTRFIFVTGGVVSSLGKGLSAASLAAILQARGYKIRLRKLDPYLNVDPGTMSPYQHGEVYVTEDGAETDLDLGHYERFSGVSAKRSDNITTGRIYQEIITRERRGDYLGATVQVIPHVTNEIKAFCQADLEDEDFCIIEVGGTVGDIESTPFLEAIRQLSNELGTDRSLFVHVTLLPYIKAAGELKTKPTQHSVKELLSVGIQPRILLCRADREIPAEERRKIALFCNVPPENVIQNLDLETIYQAPLSMHREGFDRQVLQHFRMLDAPAPDLSNWQFVCDRVLQPSRGIEIAMVGKYTSLPDAYKSITEGLTHGGIATDAKVRIRWIESEELDGEGVDIAERLSGVDGILVPYGFGERGAEGKIKAIEYARTNNVPFFGICFGMQMACIESARNLGGMDEATSSEFGQTNNPLVGLMTEWETRSGGDTERRAADGDLGGTMRLGSYPCELIEGSLAAKAYGTRSITERHRHRYEVNMNFAGVLQDAGLKITGLSPDGHLPEIVEREDHPWFLAVQFHPELKSRPHEPHPLFTAFVQAALANQKG